MCLQTVLSNSRTQLDLQSFSSGVYFYSITLNTKKITCGKFIKK
ncbi:MAG: T9SS type A sorting domain-containing protein [Bacteroidetes bacterium]|nr:T9SS type A sorting domain-containing protein [Bacteroidota bacterium]MBK6837797.1 T9SS type A sorting domain-containing protein [Bacteroidota bacterium]